MKVKELIEQLLQCDWKMEVYFEHPTEASAHVVDVVKTEDVEQEDGETSTCVVIA